jgi:catalase
MKQIIKNAGNLYAVIGFAMSKFSELKQKDRFFHANGSGFYGDFKLTKDLSEYTDSQFLTGINKKFKVALRFSTTISDHGTHELSRDNRGFSIRFFGEDEIFDIAGLSTPIQWSDKAESTSTFHESLSRSEITNTINYNDKWNFLYNNPSALHIVTMIYSDAGIPKGWQNINGYGCQTYSLINKNGERVWVKFHFKTQQGKDFYTDEEAASIAFDEPDKMTKEMNDLILSKNFPKWKMYIQIAETDAWKDVDYNMFSPTNIWPHKEFPLIEIGEIELNQLPLNQLKEFELIAFGPGNLPKGVGLSPDFGLVVRARAYPKIQALRLGREVNPLPEHIKKDFELYKNDQVFIDSQNKQAEEHYYLQPRNLWNLFDGGQKNRLYKNIAKSLSKANNDIIDNVLGEFYKIHPDYSDGVSRELKKYVK